MMLMLQDKWALCILVRRVRIYSLLFYNCKLHARDGVTPIGGAFRCVVYEIAMKHLIDGARQTVCYVFVYICNLSGRLS